MVLNDKCVGQPLCIYHACRGNGRLLMYLRFARLSLKNQNRVKSCGVAVNNPGLLAMLLKNFLIPSVMNPSDAHNSKRGPTQTTDENESQYSLGQIPEWSEMDGEREHFH